MRESLGLSFWDKLSAQEQAELAGYMSDIAEDVQKSTKLELLEVVDFIVSHQPSPITQMYADGGLQVDVDGQTGIVCPGVDFTPTTYFKNLLNKYKGECELGCKGCGPHTHPNESQAERKNTKEEM